MEEIYYGESQVKLIQINYVGYRTFILFRQSKMAALKDGGLRPYRPLILLLRRRKSELRERSSLKEFGKRGLLDRIDYGVGRRLHRSIRIVVDDGRLYHDYARDGGHNVC